MSITSVRNRASEASRGGGEGLGGDVLPRPDETGVLAADLGRQHVIAAPARIGGVPVAEDGFGVAHRLGGDRVSRDTSRGGGAVSTMVMPASSDHVHLAMGVRLGRLAAPGHRARGNSR